MKNLCLLTDSYKPTQYRQHPPGITRVYSYLSSRGGKWPATVQFGLQGMLDNYLSGERVSARDVQDAYELFGDHFGDKSIFNRAGWQHIVQHHWGKLPLSIKAVPEGTVVPNHNILLTAENTCDACFWLTDYLETLFVQLWFPITVATQSREIKRIILKYLVRTGDPSLIDFKLHDFGCRGVSSMESAAIGGSAHLTAFLGSDTVPALPYLMKHYRSGMPGFSIPASQHSTMASWGKEHEVDAMRNMMEQFPRGPVAIVSDTYDIFKACTNLWGGILKDAVLAREGFIVVRPDSGEPRLIVLEVLNRLGQAFGSTFNEKGFRVLNPKVRVIQGDGVNIDSIDDILQTLAANGWSADNLAFGMGGALLQKLNRDTQKMAFKCSYVEGVTAETDKFNRGIDNFHNVRWQRDVFKDPITDPGKASLKGRLKLVEHGGQLYTEPELLSTNPDQLVEIFRDGDIKVRYGLDEIRNRAKL